MITPTISTNKKRHTLPLQKITSSLRTDPDLAPEPPLQDKEGENAVESLRVSVPQLPLASHQHGHLAAHQHERPPTPLLAGRQCWGKTILPRAGYRLGTYRIVDIFNFSLISLAILEKKRFFVFLHYKVNRSKGVFCERLIL